MTENENRRQSETRIEAGGRERGKRPAPRILFLCTGNSCRSQMAEGWTRSLRVGEFEVFSAGIEPKLIDPRAVRVMAEAGVDISGQHAKSVDEFSSGRQFDFVITVCDAANEACPFFPGKTKRVHAGFPDPPKLAEGAATEEEALEHYRRVRDDIRAFVEAMPGNLEEASG